MRLLEAVAGQPNPKLFGSFATHLKFTIANEASWIMAHEMAVSQHSPAVVIALRRTLDLPFPPTVLRSPTCSQFVPNLRGPGRVLCSSPLEKRVFSPLETNPDLLLHRSPHAAAFGELVELSRRNEIHQSPPPPPPPFASSLFSRTQHPTPPHITRSSSVSRGEIFKIGWECVQ